MPKPKRRLRNPIVKEVSFVRGGDNPPARLVLYKTRPPVELTAAECAELDAIEKLAAGPARTPEETMKKKLSEILAGLPEEERSVVQETLKALETKVTKAAEDEKAAATKYATELSARDAEIAKLKKTETPPDPMASLPTEIRKQWEEDRAANATLRAEVAKMQLDAQRTAFAKSLEPIEHLPVKQDDLVDMLFEVPVEKRTKIVALIKVASDLVASGRVFDTIGTDRNDPGSKSAEAQVEALAGEMVKNSGGSVTLAKARAQVWAQRPDLVKQSEAEHRAAFERLTH